MASSENVSGLLKASLLVLLAARCGDAVQALIDLWIVPQSVAKVDLGAILPVVSGVNVLWWLTFTVAVQLAIVWTIVCRRGRSLK